MMRKYKSGSAIPLVIIFSTLMLVMGLAYSKMTQTSKIQTNKIDERVKLNYAIDSMAEVAILKFQLFTAQFYACKDIKNYDGTMSDEDKKQYMNIFIYQDKDKKNTKDPFNIVDDKNYESSFNDKPVFTLIDDMNTLTDQKCGQEALYIKIFASSKDMNEQQIDKTGIRIYESNRAINLDALKVDENP